MGAEHGSQKTNFPYPSSILKQSIMDGTTLEREWSPKKGYYFTDGTKSVLEIVVIIVHVDVVFLFQFVLQDVKSASLSHCVLQHDVTDAF